MKAIIVTGTPGTGKTTVAKRLAKTRALRYIDVNQVIKKDRLSEGRDQARDCEIVDPKKLARALMRIISTSKRCLIIDSHMSQCVPKSAIELCIVTRCGLPELSSRLKKRGYSEHKVRENLDAEIFDICLMEAIEKGYRIVSVDTTKRVDYRALAESFK
jgi:adenylate kinase